MSRSKRYKEAGGRVEKKLYSPLEAFEVIKEVATAKFDESIDVSVALGVDARKSDQMVRGSVVLPHGTGKKIRVAVVAEGNDALAAEEAGAEISGKDKVLEMIGRGELDFDVLIAAPDCMRDLARHGKLLGPRGLMPSPKSGTVVKDVADAVKKVKQGQIEYKMDKTGVLHAMIGKVSFPAENLQENFESFLQSVVRGRPSSAKGKFIKKVTVSSTMGPSLVIDY
ncbi:MAG: 50S ribosomal protein L1 [Elusimicrobia bacterium]|nr:50S ribosomal protein L1 [Elusimicrobiota bacterium]